MRGERKPRKVKDERITDRQKKVAEIVVSGRKKLRGAMIEAGYSKWTANKGHEVMGNCPSLQRAMELELAKREAELEKYERPAKVRATLARQRLVKNLLEANASDSNRAAELIGKDKEVRMFEPDTVVGIFAVTPSEKTKALLEEE